MNLMTRNMVDGASILTADGHYFDFLAPHPRTITLNAIARGLANTCRFGGQCERFYSVAEHSWWLSHMVPPDLAVQALLHDAPEAFVGDVPKPLKEILPDYQAIERRVEAAVFAKWGIGALDLEVKRGDARMLATEKLQLMRNTDRWRWTDGIRPYDIVIECLPPPLAYQLFLRRARDLGLNDEGAPA